MKMLLSFLFLGLRRALPSLLWATTCISAVAQVQTGPAFTVRLFDQTVHVGQPFTLSTAASGFPTPSYQWLKDGAEMPGQTSPTLSFAAIQFSDAGSYTCRARNPGGEALSTTAVITVTNPPVGPFGRITNASVRTTLEASQRLFVGFTMQGGSKSLLIRAAGPSLARFDVFNFMPDPTLAIFRGPVFVEANDTWGDSPALLAAFASTGAFSFIPNSLDAALIRSVNGGHTAQVYGPVGGNALFELYDMGTGLSPRLTNLSARNRVGTGANILIAGLTIEGSAPQPVLFRAIGPTLSIFGVNQVLVNPKLSIFTSAGVKIAENDDWTADLATDFLRAGAFALPAGSKDSALRLNLAPGSYTVQVEGVDGGTGEALVELYELP